jgi:hypothetical protein
MSLPVELDEWEMEVIIYHLKNTADPYALGDARHKVLKLIDKLKNID